MKKAFREQVLSDTTFAGLSVVFVFLYFVFHLESLFLALIGISMIGFSFSVCAIIYQGVFRVSYISNLHNMVIFIVLGIAADDIFVFIDAWRQSALIAIYEGDQKKRMSYAWTRAVRAIAITSGTTTVAFLSNVLSPMMPIKSFGIYAAIIIPVNYVLVVLLFPPAVIIYEKHFAKYKCCFCIPREAKRSDNQELPSDTERAHNVKAGNKDEDKADENKVQQFFGGPWNKFVYKFRFLIIFVFTVWAVVATYYAS